MGHGHFLNSTGRHEHFLNTTGRHWAFLKSTGKIGTPPSRAPKFRDMKEAGGQVKFSPYQRRVEISFYMVEHDPCPVKKDT